MHKEKSLPTKEPDACSESVYVFDPIDGFDARRGYRRCNPPGVGGTISFSAVADLWRDRAGNVVTRFASQGYRFSFMVMHRSGRALLDAEMDDFCEYLADVVHLWLIEGVDDEPSTDEIPRTSSLRGEL